MIRALDKANRKPIRSQFPGVNGRGSRPSASARLYAASATRWAIEPASVRKLNFAERTQFGRHGRRQETMSIDQEPTSLLDVLGISVEEGLERQNARVILEAIGVGALDRDLEPDMRDAPQTLS